MQCTKLLAEDVRETLQIISVSCNCTGSKISIIGQQVQLASFPGLSWLQFLIPSRYAKVGGRRRLGELVKEERSGDKTS